MDFFIGSENPAVFATAVKDFGKLFVFGKKVFILLYVYPKCWSLFSSPVVHLKFQRQCPTEACYFHTLN